MYSIYIYVYIICGSLSKLTSSYPPARVKWGWELRPVRHFGFPLAPSGRRGTIWGTFDSQVELGLTLGQKWTSNSEQMALKYATCAQKRTSRNSAPYERRERPIRPKWRRSRSSQPHFTRAGG